MDPTASRDASDVMITRLSWPTPRPTARGAMSRSVWRAAASRRSTRGAYRNPDRSSGGSCTARCRTEPATTPMASPTIPNAGVSTTAAAMIAML